MLVVFTEFWRLVRSAILTSLCREAQMIVWHHYVLVAGLFIQKIAHIHGIIEIGKGLESQVNWIFYGHNCCSSSRLKSYFCQSQSYFFSSTEHAVSLILASGVILEF